SGRRIIHGISCCIGLPGLIGLIVGVIIVMMMVVDGCIDLGQRRGSLPDGDRRRFGPVAGADGASFCASSPF
ncbi:MAG: hypothetical protein M1546_13170, partial [Chloroflexi bacterium]|nr:hypothetical protein [Chloroflexota bacterium]